MIDPTANLEARISQAGPRDWPEDFSHENGNYQCLCHACGHGFVGHKRRVVCRSCFYAPPTIPETDPRTIHVEVRERERDFHAQIKGDAAQWGCGKTKGEAVADLILTRQTTFGIAVEDIEKEVI